MKRGSMLKEEAHQLLLDLGVELANHNHKWSDDLRKRFEVALSCEGIFTQTMKFTLRE